MSNSDASAMGVADAERRRYFRSDNGKANMTRPAEHADWFRLESVELGNSGFGVIGGDEVAVATKWEAPERQTPNEDGELRAWEAVKAGGPWRENSQSRREAWVGIPIAAGLGVDLDLKINKPLIYAYIQRGLDQGWLRRLQKDDKSRRPRKYIEAGDRPSAPPAGLNGAKRGGA